MSHPRAHLYRLRYLRHLHRSVVFALLLLSLGLLIVLQRGDTLAAQSAAPAVVDDTPSATSTLFVATATPTTQCVTSGGTPVAWATAAPIAPDYYASAATNDGTYAYSAGGYSFSTE